MKQAGWSEEALYDAISVCGLFNFYNRWIDATGVHDMSPEAYAMQAKRLAYGGYIAALPGAEEKARECEEAVSSVPRKT